MIGFWEIYLLDDEGEIIEHTEDDHGQLTFQTEEELNVKIEECMEAGRGFHVMYIGFDPTEGF